MSVYQEYLELKNQKNVISSKMLELEAKMYTMHKNSIEDTGLGTTSVEHDHYLFKCVTKETVKIDNAKANLLPSDLKGVFKTDYKLDKKKYDRLLPHQKNLVDICITTKPAKPSFSVSVME